MQELDISYPDLTQLVFFLCVVIIEEESYFIIYILYNYIKLYKKLCIYYIFVRNVGLLKFLRLELLRKPVTSFTGG